MATRQSEVLLKYRIDAASANQVHQSVTSVESDIAGLRAELTGVGTSAQRGIAGLRLEQQRAQAEINLRQQAVTVAQAQLTNALNAEAALRNQFYTQSLAAAQSWSELMRLYVAYGLSVGSATGTGYATPTTSYTGGVGGRTLPTPMAEGGPVTAGQTYLIGERGPEIFQPAISGRIIPNGAGYTVNVNMNGVQTATIDARSRAQVLRTIGRIFDQMAA